MAHVQMMLRNKRKVEKTEKEKSSKRNKIYKKTPQRKIIPNGIARYRKFQKNICVNFLICRELK
jgi:hypothetical protein